MTWLSPPDVVERYGELDGEWMIPTSRLAAWWRRHPCEHRRRVDRSVTWAECVDCGQTVHRG